MYATINRVSVFMLYLRDPKNLMCQLASCPSQLGYQLPTHPAERSLKCTIDLVNAMPCAVFAVIQIQVTGVACCSL